MSVEFFPDVPKIEYKGNDASNKDPLSYRHYNPDEIILGKTMKEWLRFSVCFWHTFNGAGGRDPFGDPTYLRPWENDISDSPMTLAKRRIDAAFELFTKLGVQFYTFHDADVSPQGDTLEEYETNLAEIASYLEQKQDETGVRLLWATQNLFSHSKFINGGMTNPNVDVFCHAATQIKNVMDVNDKLGGLNHVFWGGREGYQSLLNTDFKKECDQMAAMYRMVLKYKEQKGYTAQLLIEPKPREPTKHQYDYDAQTCMAFLREYDLAEHFKLNIEPNHTTLAGHDVEHDILVASQYDMLGSIDSNTGDTLLGWDTDQFPMDVAKTTAIMQTIIAQGGLGRGGLNFDCKVRRESVDPVDLFLGHIGAMDTYALGLRKAAKLVQDGIMTRMLRDRYETWTLTDIGKKIEKGEATLEDCVAHAKTSQPPPYESAKQELFEMVRNRFIHDE